MICCLLEVININYCCYYTYYRDILNHRYFDKRKLYLLGLYQALQKHSGEANALFSAASFAAFKGDMRKPILVLQAPFTVSRAGSAGVTARIIPVVRINLPLLVPIRHIV